MKYEIILYKNRMKHLQEQLGDKVKIVKELEDDMMKLEIEIDSSYDILSLFHAGVRAGVSETA